MLSTDANPKAGRDVGRGTPSRAGILSPSGSRPRCPFRVRRSWRWPDKTTASPREALTFDDVLLKPGLSEVLPGRRRYPHPHHPRRSPLNIPIIASAMDTVTEAQMAIAMAQAGGIGVIHRNLEPEEQAAQVRQVKKFESGMVVNPLTIEPERDAARGARPDEGEPHFRHSGGRARRQRRARQAGRHSHQPRRALRHRSAPDASPS